ncbi:metallophosphatase [Chelatococcus composti]|uniref:Calcineurin-like phosphoesterase domain-containing protein n=2 Tax=Chelatococcus composti TaxID=1743235 RepID=A0A841KD32_9HYPH|nr:hypothetical protein [Chelatococcus composti]GGG29791.1 metallophosphatase [Chelatococcus composti]
MNAMGGEAIPAGEAQVLRLGRLDLVADPAGALFIPDEGMLVVADLHLEKASSFAGRGVFLPPYDTRATLAVVARLVARYAPRAVVALGDSFHDAGAHARLEVRDREALAALQSGRDWLWVTGNHDPEVPRAAGGERAAELRLADVVLRHAPGDNGTAEIVGHLHPAARVRLTGRSVRRRCFAAGARRIVMPALGALTGGLNLRDAAFRPLFPDGVTALVLGQRLYAIGWPLLLPD